MEEDTGEMKVKNATACITEGDSSAWNMVGECLQKLRPIFVTLSSSWGFLGRDPHST